LGLNRTTYLKNIYPYLLEFADNHDKSESVENLLQSSISPFPVDEQKQFIQEWVKMVFELDCPVMQEVRWASWRENKFFDKCVKPAAVNQFKEKFIDWLFSEHLGKKKLTL
jgi:hypothetical protein